MAEPKVLANRPFWHGMTSGLSMSSIRPVAAETAVCWSCQLTAFQQSDLLFETSIPLPALRNRAAGIQVQGKGICRSTLRFAADEKASKHYKAVRPQLSSSRLLRETPTMLLTPLVGCPQKPASLSTSKISNVRLQKTNARWTPQSEQNASRE